jgi:hypothetical protein
MHFPFLSPWPAGVCSCAASRAGSGLEQRIAEKVGGDKGAEEGEKYGISGESDLDATSLFTKSTTPAFQGSS